MKLSFGPASLAVFLTLSAPAIAGTINVEDGIAIKGYGPVPYFTDNKPVKGVPAYEADYAGATYEFASEAHRALFVAAPATYAPQFGGFCAYGAAQGHKADIDPAAITIIEGKLYLNYNQRMWSLWQQDVPGYLHKASEAWPAVSQQSDVTH